MFSLLRFCPASLAAWKKCSFIGQAGLWSIQHFELQGILHCCAWWFPQESVQIFSWMKTTDLLCWYLQFLLFTPTFSCWGCSHKGRINIQSACAWDAAACVMKPSSSYFSWWTFRETSAIKGKVTPWGNRTSGYLFTKLRKPLVAGDIHTLTEELKWVHLTLLAQSANASPVGLCLVLFSKRSKIEVQPTACCKEFRSLCSFLKRSGHGDNVWKRGQVGVGCMSW